MEFGKYQFFPWARRGIAHNIIEKDTLGKSVGQNVERAKIPLSVELNGVPVSQQEFNLIGPADITGIQSNMIVRTSPLNGVPDFEPNLLPYVEFYDEEFAWRYTPASPATGNHLRPWLSLIVLKENEFVETDRRKPLSSILVGSADFLPPVDQLHLWAHMHSNLPHKSSDFANFIDELEEDVKLDPDGVYCRLMCPRKLESKTLYHAFLIPSFETGRLAGLGMPTNNIEAQKHAFGGNLEFPVYYRWYFRTSKNFDFEYLVKQLKPRAMDERVGVRPMDCSRPAFVQQDQEEEVEAPNPNILLLEGALKAPNATSTVFPNSNSPQPFLAQLEKLVNLNLLYQENTNEDPFVSVPYYGMNHAIRKIKNKPQKRKIPEFKTDLSNWYNDLNRDPRNRVPAGFGTRIVQQNQEKFMDQAWEQLEKVIEANKKMQRAQFLAQVLGKLYKKNVAGQTGPELIAFTKSLNSRILSGSSTVKHTVKNSVLSDAVFQPAFKKITRNNTAISRGLIQTNNGFTYTPLVLAMNKTNGLSSDVIVNFKVPGAIKNLNNFNPVPNIGKLNIWSTQSNLDENFIFNTVKTTGGLPAVNLWTNRFKTVKPPTTFGTTTVVKPTTLISGNRITNINFTTGRNIRATSPTLTRNVFRPKLISPVIAQNKFKARKQIEQIKLAYSNASFRFGYRETKAMAPALKMQSINRDLRNTITPGKSYKKWVESRVKWPLGTKKPASDEILPAMAYPDIPEAAYKYLTDIDEEFLLPNLQLIPPNTLSLLKTNQKFIESYMVGLNHEMGKELLWREYPTDLRGSYFRQFWDVSGFATPDTTPKDAENMKDIDPIHKWNKGSLLGNHNKRDSEGDNEQLVFVIKGDLLRKFPNTVIYAQKALKKGDKKEIRTSMSPEQFAKEVRFPLYQAEIKPDIKLLGFDLTMEEATGLEETLGDKEGWFFIIAEVPGEPQFGMDITYNPNESDNLSWNDLSWENFTKDLKFLRSDIAPSRAGFSAPNDSKKGIWGNSSADMASILFQRPVMVAIHSTEMLDVHVPVKSIKMEEKMLTLVEIAKFRF